MTFVRYKQKVLKYINNKKKQSKKLVKFKIVFEMVFVRFKAL